MSSLNKDGNLNAAQEGKRDLMQKAEIHQMRKDLTIRDMVLKENRLDILMETVLGYNMHELWRYIGEYQLKRQRSLILAFRGLGKSTMLTIGFTILRMLQNPDIRTLIVTRTDAQAQSFLREIKINLENENLVRIFGRQKGDKWDAREIDSCNRTKPHKESTITVSGFEGGGIVSKHFECIVLDDLIESSNSMTEVQRDKLRIFYYQNIIPTMMRGAEIHVIGTRYDPNDLYNHFREHEYKDCTLEIPALVEDENGEEVSVFPESYPTELFLEKRKELGSIIFNSQYQMDVSTMGGEIISADWIHLYTAPPPDLKIWTGVDLAISQTKRADKFAMVTIGISTYGNIYILDAYTERITFFKQSEVIIDKFNTYDPIRMVIEKNAYQDAKIQELNAREDGKRLRIVPVYTTKNKDTRLSKLAGKFESGRIYVRSDMQEFISQAVGYPKYRYDDLLDALDFAVTISERGVERKRSKRVGLM